MLIHYNKIITASACRFLGFTQGIESLLFKRTAKHGQVTLQPDHNKLVLVLKVLQDCKAKPQHKNNKQLIQTLINCYSDRCIHATLYALYSLCKKCLTPTMEFCRSHIYFHRLQEI